MDFTMTEAQAALGALAREILGGRPASDTFDPLLWTELAKAGVLSAALPESAGGDGYGLLEQCAILVEIGRAVAPLPYLSSIAAAASTVARFGTPDQVRRWVAPAGEGSLILTAAGPAAAVRVRDGGASYVVDGSCPAVEAAPYADLVLVPVPTVGVLLVPPTDGGVSIEVQHIAGGPGAGLVTLEAVTVPADRVLPPEAVGWLRDRQTVGVCAAQLGVLERALELTAEHTRTRVQFGRAIATFQAVAQRLADAYIDVQAVRLTLWQAAWRLEAGLPCPTEVATAKFWAADAGHRVAHTAVHLHGGVGIDVEHILQRYFLAAKYHEFTLGGATEQLLHIGESLRSVELGA